VINQDVNVFVGKLNAGDKISHALKPGRHAWLHVAEGEIEAGNFSLISGDAAAFSDEMAVSFAAKSPTQVLLFDLN
jgi:redox-sensitive bicupin YhaK (pirin superfamily)